jgi:hypothetical protein
VAFEIKNIKLIETDGVCVNFSVLQFGDKVEKVTKVGFRALATLPSLRKFTFRGALGDWSLAQQRCMLWCSQFLPRLQIAGVECSIELQYDVTRHILLENRYFHNQHLLQPVQLGLQEVYLNGQVDPHPNCLLPQLKGVHWYRPTCAGDVGDFCSQFQTFTELGICDFGKKVLELALKQVGRRLTRFMLQDMTIASLPKIFQLCPNLEYVQFFNCQFRDPATWPHNLLGSLEEVFLCMDRENSLPEGLISQVNTIDFQCFCLPKCLNSELTVNFKMAAEVPRPLFR